MTPFPILESVGKGVEAAIRDRAFLVSLMTMPLLVIFASAFLVVEVLTLESMLLMSVIMLPGEFLKAVFVVLYFRFLVLGEVLKPEHAAQRQDKARAITGGVVAIVVVNFLMVGLLNIMQIVNMAVRQGDGGAGAYAAPAFLLLIGGMVLMFWAARFFFLYVPIALDWDIRAFYDRYPGMKGSFKILLLVVCCMAITVIPALMVEFFASSFRAGLAEESAGVSVINAVSLFMKVGIELIGTAILTAATAYAVTYKGETHE